MSSSSTWTNWSSPSIPNGRPQQLLCLKKTKQKLIQLCLTKHLIIILSQSSLCLFTSQTPATCSTARSSRPCRQSRPPLHRSCRGRRRVPPRTPRPCRSRPRPARRARRPCSSRCPARSSGGCRRREWCASSPPPALDADAVRAALAIVGTGLRRTTMHGVRATSVAL